MISKSELLEDIEKLEKLLPTPQTCSKLADLYILYDHLYKIDDIPYSEYSFSAQPKATEKEYSEPEADIVLFPSYSSYIEAKRQYQQGEISKEKVLKNLETLSGEFKDFLKMLYRNTDMPEERAIINKVIGEINVGNI